MKNQTKTSQLQIRIASGQKAALQAAAHRAGMDMSAYILARVLPPAQQRFTELMHRLAHTTDPAFELAELNDLLSNVNPEQFAIGTANPPEKKLGPWLDNYVAAMVEYAAGRLGVQPPSWVRQIPPLEDPVFGTELQSLRLYLLTHTPAPFRRRNIFIDASLGDRV